MEGSWAKLRSSGTPLGAENGPQLTVSKKTETSILWPQPLTPVNNLNSLEAVFSPEAPGKSPSLDFSLRRPREEQQVDNLHNVWARPGKTSRDRLRIQARSCGGDSGRWAWKARSMSVSGLESSDRPKIKI